MKKKTIFDLQRVSVEEYRREGKLPLVVVLDNVRSLNNIGSIFRTSDAFRVERLMLCGITATPPSIEIHKTALGAEDSVAWEYFPETMTAVEKLKEEKYTMCCLEQVHDSVELQDFVVERGKRYAIVVGHEVDGVDPRVVDACHYAIEIPQEGTKHSLNVAVSTGIALWHFFSHLGSR
ncbi:MAG: RNA methyltransferase [Bacteroidales bacterium]|nr:RNA methyltransferase [Bacteroidales bacterium]MCD8394861.1 RNA methyltransferase [Bacteroidales bacterium]